MGRLLCSLPFSFGREGLGFVRRTLLSSVCTITVTTIIIIIIVTTYRRPKGNAHGSYLYGRRASVPISIFPHFSRSSEQSSDKNKYFMFLFLSFPFLSFLPPNRGGECCVCGIYQCPDGPPSPPSSLFLSLSLSRSTSLVAHPSSQKNFR